MGGLTRRGNLLDGFCSSCTGNPSFDLPCMSFQWWQQGTLESKLTGMKVMAATLEQWLLYHLSPQAMRMLTIYIQESFATPS